MQGVGHGGGGAPTQLVGGGAGLHKKEVSSIAVIHEGKLLMGKRRDNGRWTLPGGHLNDGEHHADGARRELLEEAGIDSDSLEHLGSEDVTTFTGKPYRIHAYKHEGKVKTSVKNDPDKEVQRWQWIDIHDGKLPQDIIDNLHSPKNIVLRKLGLLPKGHTNEAVEAVVDKLKLLKKEICIPQKELVEEHEHLINVLESPSHEDDKKEAKKQKKELEEYKKSLGDKLDMLKNENAKLQRAKKADLITLPDDVKGTNCGNCKFFKDNYCTHKEVDQPVTKRMCCAFWDNDGAKREWESVKKSLDMLKSLTATTDEEAHPLMNRIEDKYFIPRVYLNKLTLALKEKLHEGDIDTFVRYNLNQTIYLDSKDLDCFRANMEQQKPRFKVRIRRYAPNGEKWEDVAYAELKIKTDGAMTNKIRIRIPEDQIRPVMEGVEIQASERLMDLNRDISKDELTKRIVEFNGVVQKYGLRKAVMVVYERRAYSDKKLRITVDDTLKARPLVGLPEHVKKAIEDGDWKKRVKPLKKFTNGDFLIVEVKHQEEVPGWVNDLLKECEAKQVKFSKYCAAVYSCLFPKALGKSEMVYSEFILNSAPNEVLLCKSKLLELKESIIKKAEEPETYVHLGHSYHEIEHRKTPAGHKAYRITSPEGKQDIIFAKNPEEVGEHLNSEHQKKIYQKMVNLRTKVDKNDVGKSENDDDYKGKEDDLTPHHGKKVFAYYNLHHDVWSLRHKGKVIAHAKDVHIDNPKFHVQEGGRQRVLREQRKNVHAGVVGTLNAHRSAEPAPSDAKHVSYNPYKAGHFYDKSNDEPVHSADYAKLSIKHQDGKPKGFVHAVGTKK